jgi:Cdc6-like AAA superfamily ATPase
MTGTTPTRRKKEEKSPVRKKEEETGRPVNHHAGNAIAETKDAKRVAEATRFVGGEKKDVQKKESVNAADVVDLTTTTREEEEKKTKAGRALAQPPKVHSFFQKRIPSAENSDGKRNAKNVVPGASLKTPYEEAVKHLPPIHVNCPVRTSVVSDSEYKIDFNIAVASAAAEAAERQRTKSSSSFQWRYEIKSDDEKSEENGKGVKEEEEEEPNDEYSQAIINRLESQFRAATEGTPWVEVCKPTRASETLGSQNAQPADLCRNWLTNWRARIESNMNATKHAFRNARRQQKNNQYSDSEDSDAKWEREMGMELSDNDDYEGEMNDGFGDGSGANIANGLIVFGDSGSGKTATIRAVASELGFSILEVNAGQNRTGRDILERFGESLQSKNLLNKRKNSSFAEGLLVDTEEDKKKTGETAIPTDDTKTSDKLKKKKKTTNGKKAQKSAGNNTLLGFIQKKETGKGDDVATNGVENDEMKREEVHKKNDVEDKQQQNSINDVNNTIVVFEDVDCLFSSEDEEAKDVDRGLVPAIATLLEAAKRPIVVVCKSEESLDGDYGQLRQLTSLGTSTTRVGFEKPSVEELAEYLRLCCLAKAKAASTSRALPLSHCLRIAKLRKGDIRGALNDCEVLSVGTNNRCAIEEEGSASDEETNDFLFDVALPLLNDTYSNGALPVGAFAFTDKISKEHEMNANNFMAKYTETCEARFLEYSLKENEKREKAKAERRRKKLDALGLKESQVDPNITAWKDLEEEENKDLIATEKEEEEELHQEEQKQQINESVKCTPVKNEPPEGGDAMEIEDNENNYKEGDDVEAPSSQILQQNFDLSPSPLTSVLEVAEASAESAEFWETHVQRMNAVSNLSIIQTNFDALTRPKPYGANGRPLSMKPGIIARYVDYCDTFDNDTKETQFVDEDFLLTGGEPRKQFGDERKRVSSQCIDVGLQRFKESVVGTVLREGLAGVNFTKHTSAHEEKATINEKVNILLCQRECATLLNPKLESSNSVSLATYVGFASKIAKARFRPSALDTPGKTRTRRAKVSMHLDKFVGLREQERIASLSNFNR